MKKKRKDSKDVETIHELSLHELSLPCFYLIIPFYCL